MSDKKMKQVIQLEGISRSELEAMFLVIEKKIDAISPEEKHLTSKEAAEMLNMHTNSLINWKKSGKLIPVKVGNRNLYKLSDVKQILIDKQSA